jgi:hypothetical protein
MMSEDQFWTLIAEARSATATNKEIPKWLEQRLMELPAIDSIDFSCWLATFVGHSYTGKLWAAASILEGRVSADGFFGFQGWLIGQGKGAYEAVIRNPDSLAEMEFPKSEFRHPSVGLELLFYSYFPAYHKYFGRPADGAYRSPPDYQPPPGSQGNPPPGVSMKSVHEQVHREYTAWLNDPEKLTAAFPKLVQRFGLP